MAPDLPEAEIQRVVRERMREGVLPSIDAPLPAATDAKSTDAARSSQCIVCGFAIGAGRKECQVSGGSAHEICAMIWRDESDNAR